MLTKKQVFEAALKYAQEQNPGVSKAAVSVNDDFIAGARWAAGQMKIKNDRLIEKHKALDAENLRLIEQNAGLRVQIEILTAAVQGLVNHIGEIDNKTK